MAQVQLVSSPQTAVIISGGGTTIEIVDNDFPHVEVMLPGIQGPRGAIGPPGPASLSLNAASAVSALRALTGAGIGSCRHAAPGDPVIGLALTAAALGAAVTIQTSGVIDITGLSLAANSIIFLAADGVLTVTPPSSGYLQRLGVTTSTTGNALSLVPAPPIQLT